MTATPEYMETLLEYGDGDWITFVADGVEYEGVVTDVDRDPVDHADGIPIPGGLVIDIDAAVTTYEETDLPSEFVTIRAAERSRDSWKDVRATVWDPVVDEEGYIVDDEYHDLGEIESVEEPSEGAV